MKQLPCTCGAEADVRVVTRRAADGGDEIVYRVVCPVCGQRGPAVAAAGKDEAAAVAEAVAAWNALVARDRPPIGRLR
jgi:transcriptional regulator NrdR family protein